MANPIIYSGAPGPISGSTPFGFYDLDTAYQADGPKVANYVAYKLGYPVLDIELQDLNIYACFEESVSIYAEELYHAKIKDNYFGLEGSPTSSALNNTVVVPSLNSIITVADNYGSAAGVGGTVEYYTGSITLVAGQQIYDIQQIAVSSSWIQQGDRMVVQRVFYESTPAINQYYDPYIGGSINYQGATENFGWSSYSPGLNFVLFPVYWDIQRIQEIEMSNQVRRSAFTFELVNNKLRIFPRPEIDGMQLWINYSKKSELSSITGTSPYGTNTGLVTNPSNVPYTKIQYSQINQPGKQWIYEYTLALASELLGLIRGKYTQLAIPGAELTLNGQDLITKGQEAQNSLREKLRQDLEDMSRRSQLERKDSENQSITNTLTQVPTLIYIG
jgi:hypothetical protein